MTDGRATQGDAGTGSISRRAALPLGAALALALARSGQAVAQDATPAADGEAGGWVVLRRYRLLPDATHDDVLTIVSAEFVPLMQAIPGFIQYMVIEASAEEEITFSVFADEAAADEANAISMEWAPVAVGHLVEMPAFEVIAGPVGLEAGANPAT